MSSSFFYVFAAAGAVYTIAIVFKLVGIWNQPDAKYEFSFWDGGLLLRGKQISKQGAVIFAIVMGVLTAVLIYYATQIKSYDRYL